MKFRVQRSNHAGLCRCGALPWKRLPLVATESLKTRPAPHGREFCEVSRERDRLVPAELARIRLLIGSDDGIPHYRLNASAGIKVINQAFHIQTVNNLHNRFETFMKPFCDPATRNLPGYAAWFITKLMSNDTSQRELWRRLLA